jgi:hypothetical protein
MVAGKWQMVSSLERSVKGRVTDRERERWGGLGFSSNASKRSEEVSALLM